MIKKTKWKWVDVALRDFFRASFDDISSRFRGESPVGLITKFEATSELVVVNVFSPLNTVFWACPHRSAIWRDSQSAYAVLETANAVLGALRQEFKANRIYLGTSAGKWFSGLQQLLMPQQNKAESLSTDGLYREYYRHGSCLLPTSSLALFQEQLQCEVAQFGPYAFFPSDECEPLVGSDMTKDEFCYESQILAARIGGTSYTNILAVKQVLSALEETVAQLEAGEAFDFNQSASGIVKSRPSSYSYILKALSEGELWETERKVISNRARLVRLLGWPSHYEQVQDIVKPLPFLESNVASAGITTPYNVLEELSAYLEEMKERYPVLREPSR